MKLLKLIFMSNVLFICSLATIKFNVQEPQINTATQRKKPQ